MSKQSDEADRTQIDFETTQLVSKEEEEDRRWMQYAIKLAGQAGKQEEVPVGAVLVYKKEAIGEAWNTPISSCDPSAHAEINAIRQAAKALNNYRLPDTTLYTTLEPCAMCAGAVLHARIERVVFAAEDPKAGAAGSFHDLLPSPHTKITRNVLREEASELLKTFFQERR